MSNRLL